MLSAPPFQGRPYQSCAAIAAERTSGIPLYLQLVQQIAQRASNGDLAPGERLPTVKDLAASLRVNPNTVARAYRQLRRSGIIESSPGRGSFICDRAVRKCEDSLPPDELAHTALFRAVRQAQALQLSCSRVQALFDSVLSACFSENES